MPWRTVFNSVDKKKKKKSSAVLFFEGKKEGSQKCNSYSQLDPLICFSSVTSQAVIHLAAKFISYEVINKAGQSQ